MERYNENAAALTWEIVNYSEDIGKWEMTYMNKDGEFIEFNGNGFEEFLNAAVSLSSSINVVYVKKLRWFVHLAKNFVSFKDKDFFASYSDSNKFQFFYISVADNVQLRNWDQFWEKTEDRKVFLQKLDICRTNFVEKGQKSKKGLEKGYKTTLAHDMWADEKIKYYLYQPWARDYCKEMVPKDEHEMFCANYLDKGGFYYQNPTYLNKRVPNVHQYDISSAYLGYLSRKKFPLTSFTYTEDCKEIQEIISKKFYCYYGLFHFKKLQYRNELFKIDLARFGQPIEGEMCSWSLILTNVDIEWFKKCFTWEDCRCEYIYYAQQREFCFNYRDYAKMFAELYEIKDVQKKGTFAKEISKFRAELPYGQSIKAMDYPVEVIYDDEENEFITKEKTEKSYDDITHNLVNRGIPFYVGLWVVAYSRLEFFNMLYEIGFENVIYGDTDSVKFVGEEGIEAVKRHNMGVKWEFSVINKKRNIVNCNEKLGQWIDEGDLKAMKAIGAKWYITIKMDGEAEIKASGADTVVLNEWIKTQEDPLSAFNYGMEVPGMFREIRVEGKGIYFGYRNEIDNNIKKDILRKGTSLYYYNPYEEQSEIMEG